MFGKVAEKVLGRHLILKLPVVIVFNSCVNIGVAQRIALIGETGKHVAKQSNYQSE